MTKGPCPLESRPRGVTLHAVERSTERLWSPLDFVSGYGAVPTPFRARPTTTPTVAPSSAPRAWERNGLYADSGGERFRARGPATKWWARVHRAGSEPSAGKLPVERSIPRSLPLASGVPQGGTPWVDSFPYFLANQEIGNARPLLSQRVPSHGMGRRRLPGKTSTNSNLSLYTPSERSPLHGKGSNRSAGRVAGNRADL